MMEELKRSKEIYIKNKKNPRQKKKEKIKLNMKIC